MIGQPISIAELRRRMAVGTYLELVNSLMGPVVPPKKRVVKKHHSNSIEMDTPEGRPSWLTFSKGNKASTGNDHLYVYEEDGELAAEYRVLP